MRTKAIVLALIFFGAMCASAFIVPDTAEAKCIYCKRDKVYGDCGSAPSTGSEVAKNPKRKHKHESNGKDCVWCGQQANSQSCSHSPTGKHEK